MAPETNKQNLQGEQMDSSTFSTVNPATSAPIETFSFFTAKETDGALVRADKTFQSFRKVSVYQRAQILANLAVALRKNKDQLAQVVTTEMGKITAEALAEIEK